MTQPALLQAYSTPQRASSAGVVQDLHGDREEDGDIGDAGTNAAFLVGDVESIGGNMIIQQCRAVGTPCLRGWRICSGVSRVYHLRLVPVRASVRWLLTLTPMSASSSAITCSVCLKRHVNAETPAVAVDISRKHPLAGDCEILSG